MKISLHFFLLSLVCLASIGTLLASDPPAARKLSEVVPAQDLVFQAKQYLESFGTNLTGAQQYRDGASKIKRDAHTLSAVTLMLAHDEKQNALKPNAAAIINASQELAKAKEYEAAKVAYEKLGNAVNAAPSGEQAATPQWGKVASMGQLMKQVVLLNNRLKRGLRRFDRQRDELARDAAVLAAIGQAIVYDTHEVKDPEQTDNWYQLCGEMRDIAGELNAKVHAADKAGAEAALLKLAQNCDDCHKAFRTDEK
jgi:hypothetical protein